MGKPRKTFIDVLADLSKPYPANTIGSFGGVTLHGIPSDDTPFIEAIEWILNLQISNPPKSTIEYQTQAVLRFVVCNFLCRKFNIAPPWPLVDDKGKPLDRAAKKYIAVLGAEATALFNLVSDVFAVRPIVGFTSAAHVWCQLLIEGEYGILTAAMYESGEAGNYQRKEQALDVYRQRTQALRERDCNPFPKGVHQTFFDAAIRLSQVERGKGDEYSINARSYRPYVKARTAVSSYLKLGKSKTKLVDKTKISLITLAV